MNPHNQENPGSDSDSRPPLDKTFIEGSGPKPASTPLTGVGRLDITSLRASNPYGQQGTQVITDLNMLPTGIDKVPLGSGTVQEILGTGGMARVYKIWNEKLEVFRAVKILLPTQQKDLRNRFETEAKITAKLHHPNIVEIYSVGDWNGLPYLEMEYIDGDSLEAIIVKRGKLPYVVCCAAAILIARALVFAHGQEFLLYGKNYHGIIHRDLKPANIMFSKKGNVKLMDFGIARPTETSLHTVDGNIVGTMQYLSPEQIDGIDIDARTDLYSFGAILYEMLTGTKTFPQETITNLIKKKIVNEYRKFSDFDFAISPVLSRITQKCLQANKGSRFESAKELLTELEAALKTMSLEEPLEILQTYLGDPANYVVPAERKTIRISAPTVKRIAFPLAAALIFLAVAGGFVVTMMTQREKPKAPAIVKKTPSETAAPPGGAAPPTAPSVDESEFKPLAGTVPPSTAAAPAPPRPGAPGAAGSVVPVKHIPNAAGRPAPSQSGLAKKYGSTNPCEIGRKALTSGNAGDAIFVLEAIPDNAADPKTKSTLLLEAYIEAGRKKDALFIATSQNIQDAHFDILCGRLYQSLGKTQTALDCFENALTKPSTLRSHSEIRNDALYYSAIVRSDLYRKDPNPDHREQAVVGWNNVKKMYVNNQSHARYLQAEKELSQMN